MRLTDLEAWVEQQFLDTNPAPVEEPEPVPVPTEGPGSAVPPTPAQARATPARQEPRPPAEPLTALPVPAPVEPSLRHPQSDDPEIPQLETYLPFLKAARVPAERPVARAPRSEPEDDDLIARPDGPRPVVIAAPEPAAVPDTVLDDAGLEKPPHASALSDASESALPVPATPEHSVHTEAGSEDVAASARGRRGRARSRARTVSPPELAPPLTGEQFWQLAPRHVRTLIAMGHDDVVQGSYKRQFKESRLALIERLLDPTLSLEDTARLLNVCPTTVRRYTNRGLLRHQRTTGDQRRFKLSDVLSFMEAQSPAEAD